MSYQRKVAALGNKSTQLTAVITAGAKNLKNKIAANELVIK